MNARRLKLVLRAIGENKISRKAAAKRLGGISERHVNRLMNAHRVSRVRPPSQAHERRLTAQARRECKERAARAVIGGQYDVAYAASTAGCSVRTMFRWVAKLKKSRVLRRNRTKMKQK